eukprot:scaffold8620_cov62-Phaeocystis_antarctica.AAC.4
MTTHLAVGIATTRGIVRRAYSSLLLEPILALLALVFSGAAELRRDDGDGGHVVVGVELLQLYPGGGAPLQRDGRHLLPHDRALLRDEQHLLVVARLGQGRERVAALLELDRDHAHATPPLLAEGARLDALAVAVPSDGEQHLLLNRRARGRDADATASNMDRVACGGGAVDDDAHVRHLVAVAECDAAHAAGEAARASQLLLIRGEAERETALRGEQH